MHFTSPHLMCAPFGHLGMTSLANAVVRAGVDPPVVSQSHGLAVDQRLRAVEAGNGHGDPCKAIREVSAASAQTLTRSPCLNARTRKPSCLILCSQPGPEGG